MGNGGQSSIPPPTLKNQDTLKRAPCSKPPFTLSELKQAIPPHCFHRSVFRSFSYVVSDLTIAFLLYQLAVSYIPHLPSPLHLLAWPTYWVLQGCILMGVWCLGHECGHHAFSEYEWLDDVVGFILHSSILVPYFSWKISHRRHHCNTQSLERDELFIPFRKSDLLWYMKSFPRRLLSLAFTLLIGWPIYISFNASGRKFDRFTNHFDPYSPIFSDRERALVIISDIGFFGIVYILFRLVASRGLLWVTCVYLAPILVENILLIMVAYLNHTHPALPHYDSSEWDWLRGALSTVDRDYGILNKVFHGVTDTRAPPPIFKDTPLPFDGGN